MSKVITLEGLRSTEPDSKYTKCSRKVNIHSSVLDRDVVVCAEDLERAARTEGVQAAPVKRKRGRPKGSTVKAGAKRPKVKACSNPRWVTRGRRSFCQCGDKGNSQMLPNRACGRDTKGKKNA